MKEIEIKLDSNTKLTISLPEKIDLGRQTQQEQTYTEPLKQRKWTTKKKYSDELVRRMINMLRSGMKSSEIAQKTGLTVRQVIDTLYSRTGKRFKQLKRKNSKYY